MKHTALETYLAPLNTIFAEEGVAEVSINKPGEVWVEKYGDMHKKEIPELDLEHLKGLARLVAQSTEQYVSEEHPLLSATLPAGYRIQVIFPPACEANNIAMSIRKQTVLELDLDSYEQLGAFDMTTTQQTEDRSNRKLTELLDQGDIKEFIRFAVESKKNLIISGGTSTGKTTFANAAFKAIPSYERLITVEDAREIILTEQPNCLHLLSSKGGQGRANVSTQDLIEACLRLRPDRIIVGELRGAEAFSFLRAINTGHPGSIATLHADTPVMAIEQLVLMIMQAGLGLTRKQVYEYIDNVVDIIVQLKRGDKGKRFVSEVYFNKRVS